MPQSPYRVLITDDNAAIHEDIVSILNQSEIRNEHLDALDAELFGNPDGPNTPRSDRIIEYRIDHAYSGEESLKKVAEAHQDEDPYALLFMDVRMPPGMDGIMTVQKVWENFPNTEIIVCSAYSDYSWDKIIDVFGKTDRLMFLQKPFNRTAIQQMSLSMVTKWELQNELRDLVQNLDAKVEQRTQELKMAMDKMRRAQKMAETVAASEAAQRARSEFLSVMGHELRTPLNTIMGFSDLLSAYVAGEKPAAYLKSIKSSGQSLITLLNDILDISKMENGQISLKYETVDLRTLIGKLEAMYRPVAEQKQLAFSVEYAPNLPESLLLDGRRLRQALVNLIGNALKFTVKGSVAIFVTGQRDDNDPGIFHLDISVKDSGAGIPMDQLSRIFDAFTQEVYKDSREHEGIGLGLTISKRLVEAMKGEISVSSEEGHGARFSIAIPGVRIARTGEINPTETPKDSTALPAAPAQDILSGMYLPEGISEKDYERLYNLLKKLKLPVMKKWESVYETMITHDIQHFGEAIQKLGGEFRIQPLQLWGKTVAGHAEQFQIEELSTSMGRFPELVSKLEKALQNHTT